MFERVFVEKTVLDLPHTQKILEKLGPQPVLLDRYQDLFGAMKKPYLQKRQGLSLFLAQKKGELVKKAPRAYGMDQDEVHYYYVHAYNCLYECSYCYLQGYFDSPDLVLFVNHHEVIEQMNKIAQNHRKVWFHGGEFSDSLALSHLAQDLPLYAAFFEKNPHCIWELRTKSANVGAMLKIPPRENTIISFSLSPPKAIKKFDLKTPSLSHRLGAMRKLQEAGHPLACHLDPIIYREEFLQDYRLLLQEIDQQVGLRELRYLSLGVMRFSEEVFRKVREHYPQEHELFRELSVGKDQKIKYPGVLRHWILGKIQELCLELGASPLKIYFCME